MYVVTRGRTVTVQAQVPQGESISTGLERFPQLLQEIEHFCRWRQQKVAKIVPYGLPNWIESLEEVPAAFSLCQVVLVSAIKGLAEGCSDSLILPNRLRTHKKRSRRFGFCF